MPLPKGLTTAPDMDYEGLIYPTLVMETIAPDESHYGEVRFHFHWLKEATLAPIYNYTEQHCSTASHYASFYLRFWLHPVHYIPTSGLKGSHPEFRYETQPHDTLGMYELKRMEKTVNRWNIIMENRLQRSYPTNTIGEYIAVMADVENIGYIWIPDPEAAIWHPAAEAPIAGFQPVPLARAVEQIDYLANILQLEATHAWATIHNPAQAANMTIPIRP